MSWRFLPFSVQNAAMNMAMDESISLHIHAQRSDPTIRLYGWKPSAVSIGCFQSLVDEVEVDQCQLQGVEVVRRRTGGGAVYHDQWGEITYSVIAPESLVTEDINQEYLVICGKIIEALGVLGIQAEFHPINDVLVRGRKISGSAQTRRSKVFLQHGTIIYDLNTEKMFSLLKVPSIKLSDKSIIQAKERVTCVRDHSGATKDDLIIALKSSFTKDLEFYEGSLTESEMEIARELAVKKYSNPSWTSSR